MQRNSGVTQSSSVPHESDFEEGKGVAEAGLCLCSLALDKQGQKFAKELKTATAGEKLDHDEDHEATMDVEAATAAEELAHEATMQLEASAPPNFRKNNQKKAKYGPGRRKYKKNVSVEKFPDAGMGIDGCILPELPPIEKLNGKIEICSNPFEKQMSKYDARPCSKRLLFSTDDVFDFLMPLLHVGENPVSGIRVKVYDSKGREYSMVFKILREKMFVLYGRWTMFVRNNDFQGLTDWVTTWMFRHSETHKLCFALISRRFLTNKTIPSKGRKVLPPSKLGGEEAPARPF